MEALVGRYLSEPTRTIVGGDDAALVAARGKLIEDIRHDRFLLAASRYRRKFEGHEYRFLDDTALRKAFAGSPEMLVDRDIQLTLRAAEQIQLDKRRWIAAAIVSGNASIDEGGLNMAGPGQEWARDFWSMQGADPTFRRLIEVARARPDRFKFDRAMAPGQAALNAAVAGSDKAVAARIATILVNQHPEFWRRRSGQEPVAAQQSSPEVRESKPGDRAKEVGLKRPAREGALRPSDPFDQGRG